tara:strand:- start:4084 stop:4482 length:399 start_codon:yes stop_codon:yes gene_type:complete
MDLEIIKFASDTKNNRSIKNHTHHSKLKNSICGDEMQIELIIKKGKIIKFGYNGKSCIYCQASASLLSKISTNIQISKIEELCKDAESYFNGNIEVFKKKWNFLDVIFKSKNLARKECILLPFKTLKKIVST